MSLNNSTPVDLGSNPGEFDANNQDSGEFGEDAGDDGNENDDHEDFFAEAGIKQQDLTDSGLLELADVDPASSPQSTKVSAGRSMLNFFTGGGNIAGEESSMRSPSKSFSTIKAQGSNLVRALSTVTGADKIASHVTEIVGSLEKGYFHDWERIDIIQVLVEDGFEIRHESTYTQGMLVELADEHFSSRGCPSKPKPLSKRRLKMRQEAAIKIQNYWINRNFNNAAFSNVFQIILKEKINETMTSEEQELAKSVIVSDLESTSLSMKGVQSDLSQSAVDHVDAELTKDFCAPSVKFAELYADHNHPRKGSKETRKPYDWLYTTTGRHCVLGGCGEQWDLWTEGQVSEFGKFGPGISNYFKFVKWGFWTFVILAVVQATVIVFNTFGQGIDNNNSTVNFLFQTTIGNLGGSNSTFSVALPGCSSGAYKGTNCYLSKHSIAVIYSCINIIAASTVLIAFVWLRYFELKEISILDKNTVSPADYTVVVSNFPKKINEMEVRAHFATITGYPVADVFFAYDNAEQIEIYKNRGAYMKERYRCVQLYRYHNITKGSDRKPAKFFKDLDDKRREVSRKIKKIDNQMKILENDGTNRYSKVLYAYVTFDDAIGAKKTLQIYFKSWWSWLCMDNSAKLKGHRLKVRRAPEPSTIIWENLSFGKKVRQLKMNVTWALACVLLFFSAVVSFVIRAEQQKAVITSDIPCPSYYDNLSDDAQLQYSEGNPGTEHCYCSKMSPQEAANNYLCQSYYADKLRADIITYFGAFVVVGINSLIDYLLRYCAVFERHASVDDKEMSIFKRLFFLRLINNGPLLLLSNIKLGSTYGSDNDGSNDFTSEWYATVGVNIILVQIGNIICPHMWKFYAWYKKRSSIAAQKKSPSMCLTQEDLNALYLGPEFTLSSRYAQLLSDFFICLLFSTGLPILVVVGAINFYVTYWIDKYLFTNLYRTPPYYDARIGRAASDFVPYAVLLYLAMAVWTMGSREIFSSNSSSSYDSGSLRSKVQESFVLPLFIMFIFLLVLMVSIFLMNEFAGGLNAFVHGLCGSCLAKYEMYFELQQFLQSNINVSYTRACKRGIIKGLANYNILRNPAYKDAFGLSDRFAQAHKRITSIALLQNMSMANDDFKGLSFMELTRSMSRINVPDGSNLSPAHSHDKPNRTDIVLAAMAEAESGIL